MAMRARKTVILKPCTLILLARRSPASQCSATQRSNGMFHAMNRVTKNSDSAFEILAGLEKCEPLPWRASGLMEHRSIHAACSYCHIALCDQINDEAQQGIFPGVVPHVSRPLETAVLIGHALPLPFRTSFVSRSSTLPGAMMLQPNTL